MGLNMRRQYHFRQVEKDIYIWEIHRLVEPDFINVDEDDLNYDE